MFKCGLFHSCATSAGKLFTHVSLSTSSIILYWPKCDGARWMESRRQLSSWHVIKAVFIGMRNPLWPCDEFSVMLWQNIAALCCSWPVLKQYHLPFCSWMKLAATTSHGFSSMCSSFWRLALQLSIFLCDIITIVTPGAYSGRFRYLDNLHRLKTHYCVVAILVSAKSLPESQKKPTPC